MRKRSISIPIRVTEKELTTIETKATKAGMNRTDYLIACAVGKRITVIDDLRRYSPNCGESETT